MAVVERKRKRGSVFYVATKWQGHISWERSGRERREAERLDARRKSEVKAGTYVPPIARTGTVKTTLRAINSRREARSKDADEKLLDEHVFSREWFATMRVDAVESRHIEQLVAELKATPSKKTGKPLAPKSVANIYGIVRALFARARHAGAVREDPCGLLHGTISRKTKKRRPYQDAEVVRLLSCSGLEDDARVFIALAFYTGMREGEVCGLRWSDFDRAPRPLPAMHVRVQYADQPLKTDDDQADRPRMVPGHPELVHLLAWWWSEGFEMVHCRKPTPDDRIVPWRRVGRGRAVEGGTHTKSSAYKMWRRACLAAGVDNISLHSTRHTFITRCRRGGAPKDVVERITHNSSGDIVDAYTTWDWEPLCRAVLCLQFDAEFSGRHLTSSSIVEAPGIEPRALSGKPRNDAGLDDGGGGAEPPGFPSIRDDVAERAAGQTAPTFCADFDAADAYAHRLHLRGGAS